MKQNTPFQKELANTCLLWNVKVAHSRILILHMKTLVLLVSNIV